MAAKKRAAAKKRSRPAKRPATPRESQGTDVGAGVSEAQGEDAVSAGVSESQGKDVGEGVVMDE